MAVVGVDLGATNIRAAVMEPNGWPPSTTRKRVGVDPTPSAVVARVVQCIGDALQKASLKLDAVASVGVGVAGQVLGDTGVVAQGPNLGWRHVPLGRMLAETLGRPVRVFNDLEAIAWAETRLGAARGYRDVLAVFAGTGVGGGAVLDGRLYRGAAGVAMEIGHVKVRPEGPPCGCGGSGCLEAYLGGQNLGARLRREAGTDWPALRDKAGGDPEAVHPGHVEALVADGDERAAVLFRGLAVDFGLVLANAVTLLNPSALVLGGTVLEGCPTLRRWSEQALRSHVPTVAGDALHIVSAELGDEAGAIGAASLALESGS